MKSFEPFCDDAFQSHRNKTCPYLDSSGGRFVTPSAKHHLSQLLETIRSHSQIDKRIEALRIIFEYLGVNTVCIEFLKDKDFLATLLSALNDKDVVLHILALDCVVQIAQFPYCLSYLTEQSMWETLRLKFISGSIEQQVRCAEIFSSLCEGLATTPNLVKNGIIDDLFTVLSQHFAQHSIDLSGKIVELIFQGLDWLARVKVTQETILAKCGDILVDSIALGPTQFLLPCLRLAVKLSVDSSSKEYFLNHSVLNDDRVHKLMNSSNWEIRLAAAQFCMSLSLAPIGQRLLLSKSAEHVVKLLGDGHYEIRVVAMRILTCLAEVKESREHLRVDLGGASTLQNRIEECSSRLNRIVNCSLEGSRSEAQERLIACLKVELEATTTCLERLNWKE